MHLIAESSGRSIALNGHPVARGGEATLHAAPSGPDGRLVLAKVYHEPSALRANKLAAMVTQQATVVQQRRGCRRVADRTPDDGRQAMLCGLPNPTFSRRPATVRSLSPSPSAAALPPGLITYISSGQRGIWRV